jgi:quinol monooxygenase YgiN
METIQVAAIFPNISGENLAAFKKLAAEIMPPCAEDPGVLQFDWFFNADETRCVVRETYKNSDAVMNHLGMVGHMIPPLIEAGGGIEVHLFGSPSEQLVEAIAAMQPTYYTYFQGK